MFGGTCKKLALKDFQLLGQIQDRHRTSLMYFEHFFFQKHWFVLRVCTGNTAMRLFSDLELSKRAETDCISATEHNYYYYRPFLQSCTQRHQPEARVDKIQWFVWNSPSEPRPHFFMSAYHLHGYLGGKIPSNGTGIFFGTKNRNGIELYHLQNTGKVFAFSGTENFGRFGKNGKKVIARKVLLFSGKFPLYGFFIQMVSALCLLTGA